jgi:mannose-6-phosphate isomerase-like protein (cupin superfamily)
MKPYILKASVKEEFMTVERCNITEVANDDDDIELSVAIARVEPGITTAWHKLDDINERYLLISGEGRVELGECDLYQAMKNLRRQKKTKTDPGNTGKHFNILRR